MDDLLGFAGARRRVGNVDQHAIGNIGHRVGERRGRYRRGGCLRIGDDAFDPVGRIAEPDRQRGIGRETTVPEMAPPVHESADRQLKLNVHTCAATW
ncbi:hypothetical protein D7S86_27395 [Pararobbsia silviterrae]|uniref:Uncharacterized protein n=1 Tax=Pararobbsia silviterrae TaxID=1792498 RepID=A0A494X9G8_9BURK|nr:hypothetical protein D7S86_27395 [Pararobbsia silviterrae]